MSLYTERECEHGRMRCWEYDVKLSTDDDAKKTWRRIDCPGGSRTEATPAEVLAAARQLGFLTVKGVTCQTCEGSGQVATHQGYGAPGMPCPANCLSGLVPSPEAIEAGARRMEGLGLLGARIEATTKAVLLAAASETETTT